MDKQETQLIKIVSCENPARWYNDYIGRIYTVHENSNYPDHHLLIGTSYAIHKSDCEPYVFPTPAKDTQDVEHNSRAGFDEGMEKLYADEKLQARAHEVAYKLQHNSDYYRLKDAFWQGCKAGAVPEGMHMISTEQLKELKESILHDHEHLVVKQLKEWFPAVFKPRKQVIAVTDGNAVAYYTGEVMGILRTTKDKAEAYVIDHDGHGSELMNYLQEQFDECQFSFDTLE